MEIDFGQEDTLLYHNLNYNKEYKISKKTFFDIFNILEAYKSDFIDIVYIGYANRELITALRKFFYNVHVIHTFEETIPDGFYEYQSKFFDEYDCSEGLHKHDLLLIDVPIEIYDEYRKSKVLLFGEADRKLYKNKIMNKKKDCKFIKKGYKYINLAKIDDVYLIDRYENRDFEVSKLLEIDDSEIKQSEYKQMFLDDVMLKEMLIELRDTKIAKEFKIDRRCILSDIMIELFVKHKPLNIDDFRNKIPQRYRNEDVINIEQMKYINNIFDILEMGDK